MLFLLLGISKKWLELPFKHQDNALQDLWNLYFGTNFTGNVLTCINCTLSNQNQYYLLNCLFYNLTNGGIIVSGSSYEFFDTDCTFYNCLNPDIGGGMYISGASSAIHRRFCGDSCKGITQSGGAQFIYSNAYYNNSMIEGTVFHCGNENGGNTNQFSGGNMLIYSINSSYNYAYWDSCFYIPSGNKVLFNYSTFGNNRNVGSYEIFQISTSYSGAYHINNFINNTQITTFFNLNYVTTFYHCSFVKNEYSTFSAQTSTLDNCYIDSYFPYTTTNSIETSFVNSLSHLSTAFCFANIPLIPDNKKQVEPTEELHRKKRGGELLFFLGSAFT